MTTSAETHAFQAEARELLDLVIHSLYSQREIFLRELVSNASDALDKLRFAALTDASLLEDDERLRIRLEVDREKRVLVVDDNGIGMSRDELVENIGTIARSGTRGFLQELEKARAEGGGEGAAPELIGQFGVGFYSAFMVASEVEVLTRRAGSEDAWRWRSSGDGEYTLEDAVKPGRGTRITLHLRSAEETEGDFQDFTAEWVLREIVKRYSDFVEYPIEMDVERTEEAEEGEEPRKKVETVVLNSQKPLWTRPKGEITEEEYTEFYHHVAHDWSEPLETIHFRAEGTTEYTALLYLPKQKPLDLFDPEQAKSRVSLYVKRVFVMKECEELLPSWLRFVRGLVDSADLPLNVSRETLQHNRQIGQIRSRLVKKVLDALGDLRERDREEYAAFWGEFGAVLKEGLYTDEDHRETLLDTCLFATSKQEELSTLAEYVERMPVKQTEVYALHAPDPESARQSPHLEAMEARGFEVLLLTDPVDEFAFSRVTEFQGKPIRFLERDDVDLETEEDRSQREDRQKEHEALLQAAAKSLESSVSEVRLSSRLVDSPAVLVTPPGGLSPQMEAMMRASGRPVPPQKRILELNPDHKVFALLAESWKEKDGGERFDESLELLYGQALLAEGSPLPDPARFAKLVTRLLVGAS